MDNELTKSGEVLLYQNGSDREYVSVVFQDELTRETTAKKFLVVRKEGSYSVRRELVPPSIAEKFSVVRKERSSSVQQYEINS